MDLVMMISRPPVTILCVMLTNERRKIEKDKQYYKKAIYSSFVIQT